MAKIYPEGTLVTSGFSKWSSAGGWRVGYIVVPSVPQHWAPFMTVLQSAASQTYSCAPAPMQFALATVVVQFISITLLKLVLVITTYTNISAAISVYQH